MRSTRDAYLPLLHSTFFGNNLAAAQKELLKKFSDMLAMAENQDELIQQMSFFLPLLIEVVQHKIVGGFWRLTRDFFDPARKTFLSILHAALFQLYERSWVLCAPLATNFYEEIYSRLSAIVVLLNCEYDQLKNSGSCLTISDDALADFSKKTAVDLQCVTSIVGNCFSVFSSAKEKLEWDALVTGLNSSELHSSMASSPPESLSPDVSPVKSPAPTLNT